MMMRPVVLAAGVVGATAEEDCAAESDDRRKFRDKGVTKAAAHAGSNRRIPVIVANYLPTENLRASRELILQPNEERPGSIRTDGHTLEYLLRHPGRYHMGALAVAERAQITAALGEIRNFLE
jgi:hypothetical protein